ncbi:MAG: helix-turn-helix domain-containing protein [Mediterranea sp.]|jgi:ligand-binding sensor domain-containing protein/AraC-like DNA-binding protein|nr:helix-turn-helix domain-containing protein [Mediterranea sp.]
MPEVYQKTIRIPLLILLSWAVVLSAGAASARLPQFRALSAADGLSDLTVNALYKDASGYVWIGTGNSVERFDGAYVKHFPVPGTNEKAKRVNTLAQTADGQLWMGNAMGLWRVDTSSRELLPVLSEAIRANVRTLLPDAKGGLYVGTEAGLFVCGEGKAEQVRMDGNLFSPRNVVKSLATDGDSLLWIATADGLYAMRTADRRVTRYADSLADTPTATHDYTHVARVGASLFLASGARILRFDIASASFEHYFSTGNLISSLSTDGKATLHVGTDGGGVLFISADNGRVEREFRHGQGGGEGLRSNSVYSLLVDRDGLIWVGFYQQGLDYSVYQSGLFHTYRYPPYFDSKDVPVRSVAISGSERLIGSRDGLFYVDEATGVFRNLNSPRLRSSMIFCIYPFAGQYYIGTYGGGMYVFDPTRLAIGDFDATLAQPFLHGQVFCIRADRKGDLWMGTNRGLFRYRDGKRLNHYTDTNSKLPPGNVYEIYFDSTGKGWICTENGVCLWDPVAETLNRDLFPKGFVHDEKIRVVYEDSEHNLYFLPDKGDICVSDLSMTRFRRLSSLGWLAGKDAMFIIEDAEKWLWIGTTGGLFRYDKQEALVPYGFVDGIPGPIFTLCPPVPQADTLWMGNSRGLVYVDLKRLDEIKKFHYPPQVTELSRIGHDNVTLRFSDFGYSDPAYAAYEYRLEGHDKEEWKPLAGRSELTYYNLPVGNYVFRVRPAGGGVDDEASVSFSVSYPLSVWGIVAIGLAMAFAAYVFWQRRGKRRVDEASPTSAEAEAKPDDEKYRTYKFSPIECRRLTEELETLMRREKLFTNPDLKISDLSVRLGRSANTLSYLFNQHLQRNYYDYINDYRVAEFKRIVKTEDISNYTLEALATRCGFSSRSSFFRNFKKATGITPSEYLTELRKPRAGD